MCISHATVGKEFLFEKSKWSFAKDLLYHGVNTLDMVSTFYIDSSKLWAGNSRVIQVVKSG